MAETNLSQGVRETTTQMKSDTKGDSPVWHSIRKIWFKGEDNVAPEDTFEVDLIPDELRLKVFVHDLIEEENEELEGLEIPCWTFLSDGLWSHGQKEIMLTIRRREEESLDQILPHLTFYYKLVYKLALDGRFVLEGGRTILRDKGLFGASEGKSLTYVPFSCFTGVTPPTSPTISGILLMEDEFQVAEEMGAARILARLGHQARYYPYPPWSDRDRDSVASMEEMQGSVLEKLNKLSMGNAHVLRSGDQVLFRLLPEDAKTIVKAFEDLQDNPALGLLTSIDPSANACLVWLPREEGPQGITLPGGDSSHMTGCYLAFVGSADENSCAIVEDGFFVTLTEESWLALEDALEQQKSFVFDPSGDDLGFGLEWIQTDYQNPVDGRTYYSEGGWRQYSPAQEKERPAGVESRIVLLTTEDQLERAVDIEEQGDYMSAMEEVVLDEIPREHSSIGYDLVVDVELKPAAKPSFRMALRPEIENKHKVQGLGGPLAEVSSPKVSEDVRFQLVYQVDGGSGSPIGLPSS
jgi:hypothetical protein